MSRRRWTPAARMTSVRELFSNPIEVLDSAAVELRLTDAGRDVSAAVTSRVLLDQKTFATWLVYEGSSPPGQIEASLRLPIDGIPAVVDVLGGRKTAAANYVRDAAGGAIARHDSADGAADAGELQ